MSNWLITLCPPFSSVKTMFLFSFIRAVNAPPDNVVRLALPLPAFICLAISFELTIPVTQWYLISKQIFQFLFMCRLQ